MTPQRVQLSRRKGWQLPPNSISVARPTKWGNPYRVATGCQSTDLASRTIVTLMFQALTATDDPPARESTHTAPYPTLAEIRDYLNSFWSDGLQQLKRAAEAEERKGNRERRKARS